MNSKILVELIVPDIEKTYTIFIPLNKKIGNVILLLCKSIRELNNNEDIISNNACLYNRETNEIYTPNQLVKDSTIKSGSTLILM